MLILAAMWVSCVFFTSEGRGTGAVLDSVNARSTNSFTLPSHLDEFCFYVQARVGDEGPFNLILDTGASYLVISSQVAERLRKTGALRDTGTVHITTASDKKPEMNLSEVCNVSLGDFVVSNAQAVIANLTMPSKLLSETIDGFAGMALFETGTLVMDFPHKEVRFEQGETRVTAQTVVLPCDFSETVFTPTLNIEVAGQKFQAIVDSGNNSGFTVPFRDRSYPFVSTPATVSLSANAADITEIKEARLATNVFLGGITFERPIVGLSQKNKGLIGMKVLEHFAIGFDQRHHRLLLTPATNGPVVSEPTRSLGFSLLPDENGLKVMAVIPGTDAARAGIRRGDYIIAIDGEPAKEWNQKRLSALRDHAKTFEVEMLSPDKSNRMQLKVNTLVQ